MKYRVWQCSAGHKSLEPEDRPGQLRSYHYPRFFQANIWQTKRGPLCSGTTGYDAMSGTTYCRRMVKPTEEWIEL